MKETKEITTSQYAKLVGCTPQNISKHIRNTGIKNLRLAHKINYYSRFVLIEVDADLEVPEHSKTK